ncbi:hypothetical protein LOD99_15998 [Oopsacas minuta]|uniref:Uncharacterized protein n=1 Tax=Oopsacas minuta TaxID=111878 RepID=A0AAV7K7F7_9METZ|nr:hypothetical protein LOD99_15998 [Oopsacas minuta]
MVDYSGYDHRTAHQYFTINTYLYAHQPDEDTEDTMGPWVSRYRGPLKLELKATSHMTLEQVIMSQLPDVKLANCTTFVTEMPFRTYVSANKIGTKRVVPLGELAIKLRDNYLRIQLSKPLVSDTRHKLLISLLEREDRTIEELQTIYSLLESIEVADQDYRIFTPLWHLIELISSFNSDLKNKVRDQWDPLQVFIGELFLSFKSLWSRHYDTYFRRYKDMSGFVDAKRRNTFMLPGNSERDRNSVYRLEAVYRRLDEILSIPFDQVDFCENILNTILTKHTPMSHPDRDRLFSAHQLVKETLQIAKTEKQGCENERALKLVQDKFQNEILLLYSKNPLEIFQAFKKISPAGYPQKSRLRAQPSRHREESQTSDTSRGPSNSSEMFAPPPRTLIKEGPFQLVHIQSPQHTHDRYLVLLTDLLILAKPSHTHKTTPSSATQSTPSLSLKQIIPLQFVWTSDNLESGLESHHATGFLIGWPAENSGVNNFVAIFSTAEEKRQWFDTINNTIVKTRQDLPPVKVSIHIGTEPPKIMSKEVAYSTQSSQLQEATFVSLSQNYNRPYLTKYHFAFFLVVKESQQYPLIGLECPAAIKSYFSHLISWRKGHQIVAGDTSDTGCYFLMKQLIDTEQSVTKKRFMRPFHFKKARYHHPYQDTISDTAGKLFHLSLDTIMPPPEHNIPKILKCILVKLYRWGPGQQGIFRVEASSKDVNELRRRIELGDSIDLKECRVIVVANLFKRFLRSIPGCLLPSTKYTEFAATNDIKIESERVDRIKKILSKIPEPNYKLSHLVFVMLTEVAKNVAHNQMTATNLGISVGPSILQPMEGLSVYQLEMNEIIAFIIQHCVDIYGTETPEIYSETHSPSRQFVPVRDGNNTRSLLDRGDSNDSMEFDNRTFDSNDSDTAITPTNEATLPRAGNFNRYRRDSKRDSRTRFRSEPNMQRKPTNDNQALKKNISIEITESPNSQSKSTPNSPEVVRNISKLDVPQNDTHSHSSPNSPEAPRANPKVTNMQLYPSSDEEDQPNRSYGKNYISPHYYKKKAANQLSTPLTHNHYPMTSSNYQSNHYYQNIPKFCYPSNHTPACPTNFHEVNTSPHVTGISRSFPYEVSQENNLRLKPNSLPRSKASYELSYPPEYVDAFSANQKARHAQKSRSFDSPESLHNVLPLSIQKAKAVIAIFPIIQDAQIAKVSEVRQMADVSPV